MEVEVWRRSPGRADPSICATGEDVFAMLMPKHLTRMRAMTICHIDDIAFFAHSSASKVAIAEGAHARVTLWCLEPGQEIQPHAHAGDHVWSVQEGEGRYLAGEEAHPVTAGSVIFAAAGEIHGMRAKTRLLFVSVSAG